MTAAAATVPMNRPGRFDLSRPVMLALAAVLVLLIVLPVSWLVYFAFTDRAGLPTLANFAPLAVDPAFTEPMLATLTISVSVALICAAFAAPMGWLVARTDVPFARTIRALVTASFVTPPFLGAIAWEILAAPNSGMLNQWYREFSGASADQHLFNIYSMGGVIFVIACYTFPYVFVLVANALERIPGDLEDASSILGGRTWHTARRITVPLALPALLAGCLVAFLQAMTLFGSPAILALPAGFHTMTTKIWSLFQYPPKPGLAAACALPLLVLTVILLRTQAMILGRRSYQVIGGKSGAPRVIRLGPWRWLALGVCMVVLLNPVFLPYLGLVKAAFTHVFSRPLSFENLTLEHVNFVFFEFSSTRVALKNTFLLGVLAATLGTGLALVIAYITARRALAGHRALDFLATAPVAIPAIVLGVGLFLAYTRPPFVLYGTLWILLIAFITIQLPAAYQQLQSAFRALNPELEEASRILGATRMQALRHITAPLLRSGVIATWCFIFIGTIRELSAAIMLFTADTKVISVVIFDLNENGHLGPISVLGILMLAITFAVVALANRLPGLGGWRGQGQRPTG
jgi:iron(III) transport system permease protein